MPAWLGVVPAGGAKVTGDLAQGIGTTFAAAERMKTIYGHADTTGTGLTEKVEVARLGDDGRLAAHHMTRGELTGLIAPRIEETFEYAAKLIGKSELAKIMPRRTVLTGGGSLLPGVRDVASRVLGQPVRLGKPVDAWLLNGRPLDVRPGRHSAQFEVPAGAHTLTVVTADGASERVSFKVE